MATSPQPNRSPKIWLAPHLQHLGWPLSKPPKRRKLLEANGCVRRTYKRIDLLFEFFFPRFGVSAQIGSGVVRGGHEVRFHEGLAGFHWGSTRICEKEHRMLLGISPELIFCSGRFNAAERHFLKLLPDAGDFEDRKSGIRRLLPLAGV